MPVVKDRLPAVAFRISIRLAEDSSNRVRSSTLDTYMFLHRIVFDIFYRGRDCFVLKSLSMLTVLDRNKWLGQIWERYLLNDVDGCLPFRLIGTLLIDNVPFVVRFRLLCVHGVAFLASCTCSQLCRVQNTTSSWLTNRVSCLCAGRAWHTYR